MHEGAQHLFVQAIWLQQWLLLPKMLKTKSSGSSSSRRRGTSSFPLCKGPASRVGQGACRPTAAAPAQLLDFVGGSTAHLPQVQQQRLGALKRSRQAQLLLPL
jgi:hypothetical protein